MVRLFKGVTRILQSHMQHDEETINSTPSAKDLESSGAGARKKVTDLKKCSISFAEYKDMCHMIEKLIETCELFQGVNQDLILREHTKRGLKKGSWRSSKQLRQSTRIMERLIEFTKNVSLQPINN